MKVANIAVNAVLGSVEDECIFSKLKFMKSKLRNKLGGYLDTTMCMFSQGFYSQEMLPYHVALSY